MRYRRGTAAAWTAANPTLDSGEVGYETDTGRAKVGDGSTIWVSLAYRFETGGTPADGSITTIKLGGDVTAAGKALLDDADAAAQRTTLGLAAIASSGSAGDLGAGTVPLARLSGITATEIAAANKDGAAGVASMRTLGTGASQAAAGNHTHAGGSDPWTYIVLGSDFVTLSAVAVDVTGLAFTPAANTRYEFEAIMLVRTATATVGPRPGVGWPTGMTDGVVSIKCTSSATANVFANGNINASVLGPVGGLPNTTQSYPARIQGMLIAGAVPVGTLRIQLASETAATNVTIKAGSVLKYRTVA